METLWCSEFDQMRSLLAASGGQVELEQAYPVGAVPVKVIEIQNGLSRRRGDTSAPKERTRG
jgi:hypothetical protein